MNGKGLKRLRPKKYFIACILIVFVFSVYIFFLGQNYRKEALLPEKVEFVGTYQTSQMQKPETYTKDTRIDGKKVDSVVFYGHFKKISLPSEAVYFKINFVNVRIKKNGHEIFSFGREGERPRQFRSGGMSWGYIAGNIEPKDEIEILLENPYPKINYETVADDFINGFYTCNMNPLFDSARKDAGDLVIGILMLIIGGSLFVVGGFFSLRQLIILSPVLWIALYTTVSGIWIIMETDTAAWVFPFPIFNMVVCTLCIFLQLPLLANYLLCFMKTSAGKVLSSMQRLSKYLLLAYIIGQIFGWFDAYSIRPYYFCFAVLFFAGCTLCVIYEMRYEENKISRVVILSMLTFEVFGAVEIANYYLELFKPLKIFSVGYVVFIIIQSVICMYYVERILLQARNTVELEKRLLESNVAIMLSQIHPHFLYNSIASIQMLCRKDPLMAEQALGQFADFLRGNMDSLKSSSRIPFEQELKHVKAYLSLEKIRFGDMLQVEYDIGSMDFTVPPLSIQPLVENASKHGVGEKEGGGTIWIRTREEASCYRITICDDGVGFDMDAVLTGKDNKTHVGIENVREHIETQCGGKMEIVSKLSEGTTITIKIPKQEILP